MNYNIPLLVMSELTHTIKLIMDYISKKQPFQIKDNSSDTTNSIMLTIKKELFFRSHLSKSLDNAYKNDKLDDLYNKYCKNNFVKNNVFLYK